MGKASESKPVEDASASTDAASTKTAKKVKAAALGKRKAEPKEGAAKKQRTANGSAKPKKKPSVVPSPDTPPEPSTTTPEVSGDQPPSPDADESQNTKHKILSQKERNERCADLGLSIGRVLSKNCAFSSEIRGLDARVAALEKAFKVLEGGGRGGAKKDATPIQWVCSTLGTESKFAKAVFHALSQDRGKSASEYKEKLSDTIVQTVNKRSEDLKLVGAVIKAMEDKTVCELIVDLLSKYDLLQNDEENEEDRDFIDDNEELDEEELEEDEPAPVVTGKRRSKARQAPIVDSDGEQDDDNAGSGKWLMHPVENTVKQDEDYVAEENEDDGDEESDQEEVDEEEEEEEQEQEADEEDDEEEEYEEVVVEVEEEEGDEEDDDEGND